MINYLIIFLADYAIFAVFAALPILWFKNRREAALHAFLSAFLAWAISKFIKDFYYTPRPYIVNSSIPLVGHSTDGSFPSNHTAAAFAIAMSIYFHNRRLGICLLIVSGLIGTSRILGGVHFPIDILGGATIGILVSWAIAHLHPRRLLTRYHSK